MRMILWLGFILASISASVAAESIVLVEHAVSDTTVDVGTKGDSPGNLLVFKNPVYDSANRVQVGGDQGHCTRIIVGESWDCVWTLSLRDGQITTQGPVLDNGDSVLAITGGTGKYAGAKGSLKLHARDPKATE